MSPLMKVAMAWAEALISSWALDTVNFCIISSSALSDLEFSDLMSLASCEAAGAILSVMCGGVVCRKKEGGGAVVLIWT
jgi:hypothetical protein